MACRGVDTLLRASCRKRVPQAAFVLEWMQQPTRGLRFHASLGLLLLQGFSFELRPRLIVE